MSKARLCLVTASVLAALSAGTMLLRRHALGPELDVPHGPDTWKVTMLVQGKSTGEARIITAAPLENTRQHIAREEIVGDGFATKTQNSKAADRRSVIWTQRSSQGAGPIHLRYDAFCTMAARSPESPDSAAETQPKPGEHLGSEPGIDPFQPRIASLAESLTEGIERPIDRLTALSRFVEREIANEPSIAGATNSAAECLDELAGDSAAKSRLLAGLCRQLGIPARLVTGLTLGKDDEQLPHVWMEAWLSDRWLPICPFYRHFGRLPRTYLAFGYGDVRLARGRNVRNLSCAFLVSRMPANTVPPADAGVLHHIFANLSLTMLPQPEQHLVEFLLLLPVAALVVCVLRNVIGIASFGTFAPALVGLVFRDLHSLPGVLVFVGLLLVGWLMRRTLDGFHLLQVPRTAVMLSLVVAMLIAIVVVASRYNFAVTRYVSLFPVIILVGMIERFWTLDEEDGTRRSFQTLLGTLLIAFAVALTVSVPAISRTLFRYPEALGLIIGAQLLLGRYTGLRISELYRFRDFAVPPARPPEIITATMPLRRF